MKLVSTHWQVTFSVHLEEYYPVKMKCHIRGKLQYFKGILQKKASGKQLYDVDKTPDYTFTYNTPYRH